MGGLSAAHLYYRHRRIRVLLVMMVKILNELSGP